MHIELILIRFHVISLFYFAVSRPVRKSLLIGLVLMSFGQFCNIILTRLLRFAVPLTFDPVWIMHNVY